MSNFVHIVFGDSAKGCLKYFFSRNENEYKGQVIGVRDDYSIGPIYEIDTEAGVKKRIEWFDKMLKEVSIDDYFADASKGEHEFIKLYNNIRNIDTESKVIIWHGQNTCDQTALRYLIDLLKNEELYEINVSESYIFDYEDKKYRPRALGECSPKEIHKLISTIKKIEQERCNNLQQEWQVLRASKEKLRILKDDIIIGVDENYYDNDILSNCALNFRRAARVIGVTMGKSNQLVGDTYIDYRVRKLTKNGKIEYRGKLKTMRDFEIRQFGSLNEFFSKLFNKTCEIDEDGFYHYLLEVKNDILIIDTTDITKWDLNYLSNKLILSYDENNVFSLSYLNEGKELFSINHIVISNVEFRTDEYEEKNGEVIREEFIMLFSDDLLDRFIEIKIKPYISVKLAIDHSKFDIDEEGE